MKKKGPDSLEGLFIVVVTCLISTLMFGTIELSSMLFVACITRYSTNRNNAAFPFMLCNVLQAMTGPLAGYLAQRFSVRIVVFAGSILSFVGVGGCYFAEDILVVTIFWGIVFGTGLGFATLLLPVVINDYFIEQRSKALGVCYVGSPIGFFIFPSIFELLMERYGLSGTFLFLAGINMHCIPLSMLLTRPNFAQKDEKSLVNNLVNEEKTRNTGCRKSMEMDRLDYEVSEKNERNRRQSIELPCNLKRCQDAPTDSSQRHCKPVLDEKGSQAIYSNSETSPSHDDGANHYESGECLPETNNVFKQYEYKPTGANFQLGSGTIQQFTKNDNCNALSNNLYASAQNKAEIFGHNCCEKVITKSDKSDHAFLHPPGTPVLLEYVKTDSHDNNDVENNAGTPLEKSQSDVPRKSMFGLYSDPVFILICLINGLTNLNFGTLATVIIDFGRDHDTYPMHDKYIMMCISVTGVIGMLGFGWVTDGGYMTRTRWASLTLIIGCVCILVMPETSGFVLLIIPLSIFSVCQASFFPLIPAITAEHIDGEFQEVAISACNVLGGPMYLVIPPLIGYFRDGKGSYDNIFYLMAGLSVMNSIAVFIIPYIARWRDKTKT